VKWDLEWGQREIIYRYGIRVFGATKMAFANHTWA